MMAKPRKMLNVRLPMYAFPRNVGRRRIHKAVSTELEKARIRYSTEDRFELTIRLYLEGTKLEMVDIDNRMKDVFDALQGHVGGRGKKARALRPLIPNDCQVFRVTAEKCLPPQQSHGYGHLIIRRYRGTTRHA
jgi:hypothetical protein